jgi:hypothetical protein
MEETPGIENKQDNNLALANQPNPCPTGHLEVSTTSRHTQTTPSNLRKLPNTYQRIDAKQLGFLGSVSLTT